MSDVYNIITTVDANLAERLADVLEIRAANSHQQNMLAAYLTKIDFPTEARVLEIGCGTGAVARRLATWPQVACVVGLDPSPVFIRKAREREAALTNLSFREGSAYQLPFNDNDFDVAVFHTTLCHLSDPEGALQEAYRVLRPGGWLAVFDGDYASISFGTADLDPLQICADAFRTAFINDSWLGRRTPALAKAAGFTVLSFHSHGYTETSNPDYMLTIVDRGAETLVAIGQIGQALAEALKAEARRRIEIHLFFGHITYTSLIARKAFSH